MIRPLPRLAIRVLLLTTVLSSSLHAAEPVLSAKPLWELGLGGGVLMQPQYPASDKYQTRSLGLPYVVYRGDILRIGDGGAARAVALDNGKVELSLSFAAAFDADSEGNPLRESMPDLDFIFEVCSGSINPDTNLGGNLATVNEVFNGQQTSIIYDRI